MQNDRVSTPDVLGVWMGDGSLERGLTELGAEGSNVGERMAQLIRTFDDRTAEFIRDVQPLVAAGGGDSMEMQQVLDLLGQTEPLDAGSEALERAVREALGPGALLPGPEPGTFRIEVPPPFRGPGVRSVYPAATFDRSVAVHFKAEEVDLVTPLHPLVAALCADARRRFLQVYPDRRGLPPRRFAARRIAPGEPAASLFTFLAGLSGGGDLVEEHLLAVRIGLDGCVLGDPVENLAAARLRRSRRGEGSARPRSIRQRVRLGAGCRAGRGGGMGAPPRRGAARSPPRTRRTPAPRASRSTSPTAGGRSTARRAAPAPLRRPRANSTSSKPPTLASRSTHAGTPRKPRLPSASRRSTPTNRSPSRRLLACSALSSSCHRSHRELPPPPERARLLFRLLPRQRLRARGRGRPEATTLRQDDRVGRLPLSPAHERSAGRSLGTRVPGTFRPATSPRGLRIPPGRRRGQDVPATPCWRGKGRGVAEPGTPIALAWIGGYDEDLDAGRGASSPRRQLEAALSRLGLHYGLLATGERLRLVRAAGEGPHGAYLEVDLAGLAEEPDPESFAVAWKLFSAASFVPGPLGELPLEE